jgi:hypothetical protein
MSMVGIRKPKGKRHKSNKKITFLYILDKNNYVILIKVIISIIGVCILSRVYQLNARTPPYATNVSACFIVHVV